MKKLISMLAITTLGLTVSSQANATCHVELQVKNKTPYSIYLNKVGWAVKKGDWYSKGRVVSKSVSVEVRKGDTYTYTTDIGVKKCDSKGRRHFAEVVYKCRTASIHAPNRVAKRKFKDGGRYADATVEISGQHCTSTSWSNS